jgi:excisionase family DNA binding protein
MPNEGIPMPTARLLLTPPEAARALSISPRTLWQLTADNRIRAVRIGRLVRYDVAELTRFIEQTKADLTTHGRLGPSIPRDS